MLPEIPLTESVHGALLEATKATLMGLALPGLQGTRWYIRKHLWDMGLEGKTPCGIIAPATKGIDWNAGETETDDIEYGAAIGLVAAGNFDNSEKTIGVQLVWSERATRRLFNRRDLRELALPEGRQLTRTNIIAPSEIFLAAAARAGWDAQYLIARFVIREVRSDADA